MAILELLNFFHFIGLALGVGGATIASIISSKAEKDNDIRNAYNKLMPSIAKTIWAGILLLIISGILLPYYLPWKLNTNLLILKHILVLWIIVFGIFIAISSSKIKNLAPKEKSSEKFLKTKKIIKRLSFFNLLLWYLVSLLSVFI